MITIELISTGKMRLFYSIFARANSRYPCNARACRTREQVLLPRLREWQILGSDKEECLRERNQPTKYNYVNLEFTTTHPWKRYMKIKTFSLNLFAQFVLFEVQYFCVPSTTTNFNACWRSSYPKGCPFLKASNLTTSNMQRSTQQLDKELRIYLA